MSILSKLLLVVLFVSLFSFYIGHKSAEISRNSLTQERISSSINRGNSLMQMLELSLRERLIQWRAFSNNTHLLKALQTSNQIYQNNPDRENYIDKIDKEWVDGKQVELATRIQSNKLAQLIKSQLKEFEKTFQYKLFPEVFVTNAYGVNIAQTNRTSDFRQNDERWWQEAATNESYFGKVSFDKSSQAYSIELGVGIFDSQQSLLGVMKIILNIRQVTTLIDINSYDNETILLLDSENKIIHLRGQTLKPASPLEPFEKTFNFTIPDTNFAPIHFNVQNQSKKDKTVVIVVPASANNITGKLAWRLLIMHSHNSITAPANALYDRILLNLIISTAVLLILGVYFSYMITSPIKTLTEASKKISKGNYHLRVPVKGSGEITRLSETFNNLAESIEKSNLEQKRAKEALEKSQDKLEQKVVARTNDLEELLYSVSHDLKSPLVTIQGFIGFIENNIEARDFTKTKDSIDRIKGAALRMSQLINDLLNLSKVGAEDEEDQVINVNTLLEMIRKNLSGLLIEADAQLEIESNLPNIISKPHMLTQVFENLISNAVKHGCTNSSSTIKIGHKSKENEDLFFVSDQGPGIKAEYQEKVFRLFQRLNTKSNGTGIGLAIVSKIVRSLSGRVWVENNPDKGARFWFSIPKKSLISVIDSNQS